MTMHHAHPLRKGRVLYMPAPDGVAMDGCEYLFEEIGCWGRRGGEEVGQRIGEVWYICILRQVGT